jgi:phage terminase large subunit GpA-like protein
MQKFKLNFELVPEECWRANLRSFLKSEDWDKIRRSAYAKAGGRCSICGARGRLEAHEQWSYDDENAVQKLEGVVALCHACHEVKHISRTQLVGRGMDAMEHFMKVSRCTQSDYHLALKEANEEYLKRNKIENWVTDFSWLAELSVEIRRNF